MLPSAPMCRQAESTVSRPGLGATVTPCATAGPHVSVIVTTFNHAPYIAEAIRSVLAQTYTNREIIVVDDGSTDDTPAVLAGFGDAITTIRQPNQGVAGSRNRAIRGATGLLLAFIDGDDRWHPDMLRRLVEAHERFPDSGLIACDGRAFDGERILRTRLLPSSVVASQAGNGPVISCECFEHLIRGNLIATTSQIMIPRRVIDDVGESDGAFPVASDYDLYLRIARKYRSRSCGNTSWTGATCRRARRGPRPSGNFIGPRMMSPSCASTRGWLRRRSDPSSRIRSRERRGALPSGRIPRLRDRSAMGSGLSLAVVSE